MNNEHMIWWNDLQPFVKQMVADIYGANCLAGFPRSWETLTGNEILILYKKYLKTQ